MFNQNFKDTYAALNGTERYFSEVTKIETENNVILKKLSPLCAGEKAGAIESIRFLPMTDAEKEKIEKTFGNVYEDKEDAYLVEVTEKSVTVYSNYERGFLYGACTVWTHYRDGIKEGLIYNVPLVQFRAVKLYLPAEEKLDEFYYMVDMFMHYGYNAIVLEVGGAMEYKNSPEINAYWIEICEDLFEYNGKATQLQTTQPWGKNSIHIENGGGKVLSQKLVREICAYCRAHGLEPIPECPCLSHADYLMAGRTDFAERPNDPFPDTYCPSNPKSYEVLFRILEEVIEVFEPKVLHIGHDEYYVYGICDKCKGKTGAEIYAGDIIKIHDFLAERGIRTMLWSEKLLNSYNKNWQPAGGARYTTRYTGSGKFVTFRGKTHEVLTRHPVHPYDVPLLPEGTLYQTVEETYPAIAMVPKDIIAMNWYYSYYELGDMDYHYHGIPMVYGNFTGLGFNNWKGRVASGAKGYCVSSWGASDFKQMQRGKRLGEAVYASRMAWSRDYDEKNKSTEDRYAAASVFDYRFRDALNGSHIDILHTTDIEIPHGYFGCGDFWEDDLFRLGYYHIHYKDGTDEKVEILWGENVGPAGEVTEEGAKLAFAEDGQPKTVSSSRETIFTCDFVDKDDRRYYRFVIPTKKPVSRVETEIFERFAGKHFVESITVKN